ncbi:MAG: hypothetical protein ACXWWN_00780 [Gemmatimonadales bacterium]
MTAIEAQRALFVAPPRGQSGKAMVAAHQHPHHGRNQEYEDEDNAGMCVGDVQEFERGGQQNERQRPAYQPT